MISPGQPRRARSASAASAEMTFDKLVQSIYMTAALQMGAGRPARRAAPRRYPRRPPEHRHARRACTEKTKGNLTDKEQRLLQNALFELRMMFHGDHQRASPPAPTTRSAKPPSPLGACACLPHQRQHPFSRQRHIHGCAHAGLHLSRLHLTDPRDQRLRPSSPLNGRTAAPRRHIASSSTPALTSASRRCASASATSMPSSIPTPTPTTSSASMISGR